MNERIRSLMEERARAIAQSREILDRAERENRDLNADESSSYSRLDSEIDSLTQRISREERTAQREAELHESENGGSNPQRRQQPGSMRESREDRTESKEYRSAMLRYMITGAMEPVLRSDARGEEMRSVLGVSMSGTGAVLAPTTLERSLLDDIAEENVVRGLADVRSSATDVQIPVVEGHTSAYLIAEGADFTASKPEFNKRSIGAYKVGALTYVTVEAMQDTFIDMEAWVRGDFAKAFADLEETHFINGTGSKQPSGILTGGTLGVTAAASNAVTADELMDLMYSVENKYRKRSVWLMNDSTVKLIRKLKDTTGRYLWEPSMKDGQPDMLLGKRLYTSSAMPEAAANAKVVVFGDFKQYRIMDRRGLYFQRLNEIAATSGQVAFLAYRRYDAQVIRSDALKYLAMKAST